MKWVFPEIKTTRTLVEQAEKVADEVREFKASMSDEEAIDILHAAETLLRRQFVGREDVLDQKIKEVVNKNFDRGYYSHKCY